MKMVSLGDLMPTRTQTLNPAKHADEEFELHSIPAFDRGRPDAALGRDIGSSKQVVQPGDVLISKIVPHIRRSAVVPQHTGRRQLASSEWIVFRNQSFDPKYLVHFLTSDIFHRQFLNTVAGVGGSLLRARPQYVRSIMAPLPPLDEQRRIAAILDKADAIRQKRRQAIAQVDTLTQSVLEDFSQIRSQEFKSFHFDNIVNSLSTGRSLNCEGRPAGTGEWGILKLSAVTTGTFRPAENKAFTGDPQLISRHEIRDGDLMMTRKNTPDLVGAVSIAHAPPPCLAIPDIVFRIVPNPELANNVYLQALLMSSNVRSQVKSLAGGSAKSMSNISATRLKTLELQLPSLESQEAFANVVQRIQLNRNRHQASFDLEHNLFSSLQSRAFRGEL